MVSLTAATVFRPLTTKYYMNQLNGKRYLREVEFEYRTSQGTRPTFFVLQDCRIGLGRKPDQFQVNRLSERLRSPFLVSPLRPKRAEKVMRSSSF